MKMVSVVRNFILLFGFQIQMYLCNVSRNAIINHAIINKNNELPKKDNQCYTIGGQDIGAKCIFPFKYDIWDDVPYAPASIVRWPWFHKEMVFENCTTYRKPGDRPWCATKVTSNNRYISGNWGECHDTPSCSLVEGTWLSWSNWSAWSKCRGGRCGNPTYYLDEKWGTQKQTRYRKRFSRNNYSSGRRMKEVENSEITQGFMSIKTEKNLQTQTSTQLCSMPKCKALQSAYDKKVFGMLKKSQLMNQVMRIGREKEPIWNKASHNDR